MTMLFGNDKKTFTLLSIGQRGVGKTVFIAGSYTELHTDIQAKRSQKLLLDCKESEGQKEIERILSYIAETGKYPPPTIRITDINFSLKSHRFWGDQTLCYFRWWEIPGEICKLSDQDFVNIVSNSHGSCVFIDAYMLVHNKTYLEEFEEIMHTVMSLASLVMANDFKYAFALILTKCDLLEPSSFSRQQLKERLQPLTTHLNGVKANYQTFYSHIPIVHKEGASTLNPKGAAAPLLWLVLELSKAYNTGGWMNNLLDLVTRLLLTGSQQPQELRPDDGSLQRLFRPWKLNAEKTRTDKKLQTARSNLLLLTLAIAGLVGVIGIFSVKREPKNLDALKNLATLEQSGQFDQAVQLIEKLIQQEPKNLELRLELAHLYKITNQLAKAETAYDQVLTQQNNNLQALVGKATMRKTQGDITGAKALFAQAEKAAPTDNTKAQIRKVAQITLNMPTKQTLPPQ